MFNKTFIKKKLMLELCNKNLNISSFNEKKIGHFLKIRPYFLF